MAADDSGPAAFEVHGLDVFDDSEDEVVAKAERDFERGFSDADLAVTLRVLSYFKAHPEAINEQEYKGLRVAMTVFVNGLEERAFKGVSKKDLDYKRQMKMAAHQRASRQKEHDRKIMNSRLMRAERLNALNALMEPPKVPLLEGVHSGDKSSPATRGSASGGTSSNDDESGGDGGGNGEREGGGEVEQDLSATVTAADGSEEYLYPRSCYTCKDFYTKAHHFYASLCPRCAELNWTKRHQTADLTGKVFVLTGCRIKIGFQCGLKLLRAGATVVGATRFPHDAALRYAAQPDFAQWSSRLHLYGLDLRDLHGVTRFTDLVNERYPRLDGIVNNAAQTVRRPAAYYHHLLKIELQPATNLPAHVAPLIQDDPHVFMAERLEGGGGGVPASVASVKTSEKALVSVMDVSQRAALVATAPLVQPAPAPAPASSSSSSSSAAAAAAAAEGGGGGGGGGVEGGHLSAAATTTGSVITSIPGVGSGNTSAAMSQLVVHPDDVIVDERLFPQGRYDVFGQQVDLRPTNSWTMRLHEVDTSEAVESHAVNALSPFILNSRLKTSLLKERSGPRFVVNVSAMEGKFYRHKNANHPHTNMAKAALNMLTRTSAQDYATDGIYMTSVDTGWITDENPYEKATANLEHDFQTPIDEEDAAARVLDPLLSGFSGGELLYGVFLKDYKVTEW